MIRKLTFAFISVLFVLNFSCTSSNVQSKNNSNNQNSLINNENFNSSISATDSDVNEIVSKTSETKDLRKEKQVQNPPETEILQEKVVLAETDDKDESDDEIKLLFAGDIMAHTNNYHISSFDKIWRDVKHLIDGNDFAFANMSKLQCLLLNNNKLNCVFLIGLIILLIFYFLTNKLIKLDLIYYIVTPLILIVLKELSLRYESQKD